MGLSEGIHCIFFAFLCIISTLQGMDGWMDWMFSVNCVVFAFFIRPKINSFHLVQVGRVWGCFISFTLLSFLHAFWSSLISSCLRFCTNIATQHRITACNWRDIGIGFTWLNIYVHNFMLHLCPDGFVLYSNSFQLLFISLYFFIAITFECPLLSFFFKCFHSKWCYNIHSKRQLTILWWWLACSSSSLLRYHSDRAVEGMEANYCIVCWYLK